MTTSAVLAIDQGTSGTKAVVVDAEDGILGVAERVVSPRYLPGGGVEQDPTELLDSVLDAGRAALAQAGRPVQAVSLANQGETVLAWHRATGRPIGAAIGWQDRRAESVVVGMADAAEWVAHRTGLVLDPYFSAPKMAWLRRNVTGEGVVTTTDTWLIHQLCSAFVTDVATASRSLLTDLDTGDWNDELRALFGWADEAVPDIVDCDHAVGTTRAFGDELPVAGLIVDQQAALLAEACLSPGYAKCTFGTGAFLLANTGGRAVRSAAGLSASVAWRLRDQISYCLDGQVYTAASAVRWLSDLGIIAGAEDLDRLAAADPGAVLCVPALAGLGAPWWRADATAALTGLTLSSGRGEVILAVLQGIAAQIAELAAAARADGVALDRLRVDGGLVQCRTLMQATADLVQVPLEVYPSAHATALGAAALGRLAMTPSLSVADAVPAWTPSHTYEPRWSPERAEEFRADWRRAVSRAVPERTS